MPFTEQQIADRIAKHKSEFIYKANLLHNNKYIYDIDKYASPHVKMEITCPEHGVFFQKPYDHLYGKGCRKCAIEVKANKQKLSTNTFIAKATGVHGNKYDYSKVDYTVARDDVIIVCPIHGEFTQNAHFHTRGNGCPECGKVRTAESNRLTTDDFLKSAKATHGDKYDYSKTIYVHCDRKIVITCPKHGDFLQTPSNHVKGSGCVICRNEKTSIEQRLTLEDFVKKAKQKHGDKYDYSKVNYTESRDPVLISCPIHGDFTQIASAHVLGRGCRKCSIEKRTRGLDEFISMAKERHGDRYKYCNTHYTRCYNPVVITCRVHGDFSQQANSHIQGSGCPLCAESRGERDVAFVLNKLGISYARQYMIPKNLYKYDFYIPSHNLFIEYHGVQHYERVKYFHRDDNSFKQQLVRDSVKRDLVRLHKGRLIVIRYNFKTREQIEKLLTQIFKRLKVIT